jgi:preprotein translocase subunit SecD
MTRRLWIRIGIVAVVAAWAALVLYPPKKTINLGLDLQGGIHLVLGVDIDKALQVQTERAGDAVRAALEKKGVGIKSIERRGNIELVVQLASPQTWADAQTALKDVAIFDVKDADQAAGRFVLAMRPREVAAQREWFVKQGLETIRNRVDQFGVAEPVIQRQGLEGDRIVVQLPGVDDPARVKEIIHSTAFLEIKPVVRTAPTEESLLATSNNRLPEDSEVVNGDIEDLEGRVTGKEYYLLKKASVITGRDLRNARRSQDQYGQPAVSFTLNPEGAKKFGGYTGAHIGDRMAIVLDNKVRSAPVIRGHITDSGIIEGNFTVQGAEDLALVLRAGALPASITYLEERTVGPSLGRDSVNRGLKAGLVGLVLVAAFMLAYYKGAGINANVALILNAILLLGAIGALKATLTLPGIAGVILTIGMAVDSNVLVFERIREELELGKTVRNGVALGFQRAFATIIDTHVTTIVSALFLFQFGTGPIKGFAVTLTVGLAISMFTAVFVSRTIFETLLSRRAQVKTLSI